MNQFAPPTQPGHKQVVLARVRSTSPNRALYAQVAGVAASVERWPTRVAVNGPHHAQSELPGADLIVRLHTLQEFLEVILEVVVGAEGDNKTFANSIHIATAVGWVTLPGIVDRDGTDYMPVL